MPPISELEDKYDGERAFMIGNGPSLTQTPLERLNSEHTFVVNKIHHIYDARDFQPSFFFTGWNPDSSYFAPIDSENNTVNVHVNSGITCFLNQRGKDIYGNKQNIYNYSGWHMVRDQCPFHRMGIKDIKMLDIDHLLEFWSSDPSRLIYKYHSMYCLAQIVAYLGFDEIYFVGVDLGKKYADPHMIFQDGLDPYRFDATKWSYVAEAVKQGAFLKSICNGVAFKSIRNRMLNYILNSMIGSIDTTHFSPEYTQSLEIDDGPKQNREFRKSHVAIKRILDHSGVDVYNATVGGELEVYSRVDIDKILNDE